METLVYISVLLIIAIVIVIIVIDSKRSRKNNYNKKSRADMIANAIDEGQKKRDIIFNAQRFEDDDYGYSKNNPICTSGVQSSDKYLHRLRTSSGEQFTWKRNGSFTLENYHSIDYVIIDEYQLFLNDKPYKIIYLCPYGHNCDFSPLGMQLISSETGLPIQKNHISNSDIDNKSASNTNCSRSKLYNHTYEKIYNILKLSDLAHNVKFEIYPILYVIIDYVAFMTNKDRKAVSDEALKWIKRSVDDFAKIEDEFNKRVDFYGDFIRGKKPFMNWSLIDAPEDAMKNPIFRCIAAFGDVIYYPNCINDYDHAPLVLNGIDKQFDFFTNSMKPVISLLQEFTGELIK